MNLRSSIFTTICLIVVVFIEASQPLLAQQNENSASKDTSSFWFNLGFGPSTPGIAIGGSYTLLIPSSNKALITVRFVNNEELAIFSSPAEKVWDLSFLYGLYKKGHVGFISISSGIGIIGGTRREELVGGGWFSAEYDSKNFTSLGLSIESQLFYTPFKAVGIGITAFGNLNPEESFAGAMLCIQVGRIR